MSACASATVLTTVDSPSGESKRASALQNAALSSMTRKAGAVILAQSAAVACEMQTWCSLATHDVVTEHASISRRFSEWAERYNAAVGGVPVSIASWAVTGVFGVALVLVSSRWFALPQTAALAVLVILCATTLGAILFTRRASHRVRAAATLVKTTLTTWFVASLVALSNERGATIFALLPVFVWAYHGYSYRLSWRYPFHAVSLIGFGAALAMDASRANVFAVIVPLAVVAGAALGTVALRTDALDAEREQLRAAVLAQALEESSLGQNHDVGNALAAARVNADWLLLQTQSEKAIEGRDLSQMSIDLHDSLERLGRILAERRRIGREMGAACGLDEVNVSSGIERAAKKYGGAVALSLDIPKNFHALVRGGETSFERIVDNLLENAFEGTGERGATSVGVHAKNVPVGHVTIEIVDDGPGFSDAALRDRIAVFVTTKKHGGGLGLYIVERLVAASGGQLTRANRPEGGAVVRVVLAKGGAAGKA